MVGHVPHPFLLSQLTLLASSTLLPCTRRNIPFEVMFSFCGILTFVSQNSDYPGGSEEQVSGGGTGREASGPGSAGTQHRRYVPVVSRGFQASPFFFFFFFSGLSFPRPLSLLSAWPHIAHKPQTLGFLSLIPLSLSTCKYYLLSFTHLTLYLVHRQSFT